MYFGWRAARLVDSLDGRGRHDAHGDGLRDGRFARHDGGWGAIALWAWLGEVVEEIVRSIVGVVEVVGICAWRGIASVVVVGGCGGYRRSGGERMGRRAGSGDLNG